jgi:hypothetical protein
MKKGDNPENKYHSRETQFNLILMIQAKPSYDRKNLDEENNSYLHPGKDKFTVQKEHISSYGI